MLVISQTVGLGVGIRTSDETAHLGKFHRGEGTKNNNEILFLCLSLLPNHTETLNKNLT